MIGVSKKQEREKLLNELYIETTKYYRYQRTQDIQSMENRAAGNARRFTPQDLAENIWHFLSETQKGPPISDWITQTFRDTEVVEIPEGKPEPCGASDLFNPTAVIFRNNSETRQVSYRSPEQAEVVAELAVLGIRGHVTVPTNVTDCRECLEKLSARVKEAESLFSESAALRTGVASLQEKTEALLLRWYIYGKE